MLFRRSKLQSNPQQHLYRSSNFPHYLIFLNFSCFKSFDPEWSTSRTELNFLHFLLNCNTTYCVFSKCHLWITHRTFYSFEHVFDWKMQDVLCATWRRWTAPNTLLVISRFVSKIVALNNFFGEIPLLKTFFLFLTCTNIWVPGNGFSTSRVRARAEPVAVLHSKRERVRSYSLYSKHLTRT